jgi:hypothetical protein
MLNDNEVESPDDEDSRVKEFWDNLKDGRRFLADWRTNAREDFGFYAGLQWDQADIAKLEEENRPAVTFNRIARTVNAVCGLELNNRQEVRFLPREMGDVGVNELLTDVARWVRDNCNSEDEESDAFQDAIICGLGWTETRMDYEDDPDGMIKSGERIDPLEIVYDPSAKKRNLVDRRWCARVRDYTRNEFEQMWPDVTDYENSTFWNESEDGQIHDATEAYLYKNDQSDKLSVNKKISVVQYQYWERETYYQVLGDSQVVELPADRFEKLRGYIEQKQMRHVKRTRKRFMQVFMAGKKILEETELKCGAFTLECITGLRDRNENYWFGLVALMKDPQRWANKWLSQIQHIINSNAKGGLLAEEGALRNPRQAEEEWSKTDSITWLNPGGLQRIQQKEAPRYPEGVDRLLQYAMESIQDVVGVSLEMMGMANRDQAGYLEDMRKTASISLLQTFFSAFRYYRKVQGKVLAEYIREYIADGRLVRITTQQGAKYIPLLRDKLTLKYDVIVDEAPSSPNMKERVFGALMQIIPQALQAGIAIPPDILDYSPLPETLVQKWKQMLQPDPQQQQEQAMMKQIQMMLAQLEIEGKQYENIKTQTEAQLNIAKSEQAHSIGQDEAAQAATKLGIVHAEHRMDMDAMLREQARKDVEMMLNHRRKMLETQINARIKEKQAGQPRMQ